MVSRPRRPIASIIGTATPSATLEEEARQLGQELVDRGFRIVTGGLGGVMEAACLGARSSERYAEGTTVGLLPGRDPASANPAVDIALPTNMGIGRNLLVVSAADVVVAVGGGSGTLSEIAMAWQLGKPIIALDQAEGWSAELAGRSIDDRRDGRIERATSAREAARLAEVLVSG